MNHTLIELVLLQSAYPHLAFVLLCLAKSSLVIGLTWAVAGLLRRRSALARNWTWRCAIIGLLGVTFWEFAPASLTGLHPVWHLSPTAEESATFAQSMYGQSLRVVPDKVVTAPVSLPPATQEMARHVVDRLDASVESVWFAGIIGFALWQLIQSLAGIWWLKKSASPAGLELQTAADRIAASGGLAGMPRMAVCRDLTTPLLIGWLKPSVFLPEEASRWDDQKMEAILLHELAHWQRRDGWWQALSSLISSMWWWNPLVWFAIRRLKLEAEYVADDIVVLAQHNASRYARTLVEIATATNQEDLPIGIAMVGPSSLELRIRAILTENPRHGKLGKLGVGAVVFLSCLFLSLGGFYLSAEPNSPHSSSTTPPILSKSDSWIYPSTTILQFKLDPKDPSRAAKYLAVLKSPTYEGLNKVDGFISLGTAGGSRIRLSDLVSMRNSLRIQNLRLSTSIFLKDDTVDYSLKVHLVSPDQVEITARLEPNDPKGYSLGVFSGTWTQPIDKDGVIMLSPGGQTVVVPQSDNSQVACLALLFIRKDVEVGKSLIKKSDQFKEVALAPAPPSSEPAYAVRAETLEHLKKELEEARNIANASQYWYGQYRNLSDLEYAKSTGLLTGEKNGEFNVLRAKIDQEKAELALLVKNGVRTPDPRIQALQDAIKPLNELWKKRISEMREGEVGNPENANAKVALLTKEVDKVAAMGDSMMPSRPNR